MPEPLDLLTQQLDLLGLVCDGCREDLPGQDTFLIQQDPVRSTVEVFERALAAKPDTLPLA